MFALWESLLETVAHQRGVQARDDLASAVIEVREEGGDPVLVVAEPVQADWIVEQYFDLLTREARIRSAEPVSLQVRVATELVARPAAATAPPDEGVRRARASLNNRYTFDTFVVGTSNQMAASAARAVASRPGEAYNPLFIHGMVGIGKTHLLHAVGQQILAQHAETRVLYRSTEAFLNEFVRAIGSQSMESFRRRYRDDCDVLLVDDVQFLQGKEQTQEEFFHTFEALRNSGRQICLTSDRPPKDIQRLTDRLRSRFDWGLTVDIQLPSLETRIAILQKKAAWLDFELPLDVATFLAESFRGGVRELEGSLNRLNHFSAHARRPTTVEFAREVLEDLLPHYRQPTADDVIQAVAEYHHLKTSDLKGRRRHRDIARPRQVAMYLCRLSLDKSFPEIGRAFGKDHSTVISACRRVEELMGADPVVRTAVEVLSRRFENN